MSLQNPSPTPNALLNINLIGVGVLLIQSENGSTFNLLGLNHRASKLFGRGEPARNSPLADAIPPEMLDELVRNLLKVARDGGDIELEMRHELDGVKKWLRFVLSAEVKKEDGPQQIVATISDVTSRKQAEASTLESELKFLSLAESAFLGILVTRKDRTLFANQAFADLIGFSSPDQILRLSTSSELSHEEDRPEILKFFQDLVSGESTRDRYVHRMIRKDGETIWVEIFPSLVNWEGQAAFQIAYHDITERKRADEALRESASRMRLLTDAVPVLISYVDKDLRYRFSSANHAKWTGQSPEEIIGKRVDEIFSTKGFAFVRPYIEQALAGEKTEYEGDLDFPDGKTRRLHVIYIPDISPDGVVRGYSTMAEDITERKKAEAILRESEERYRTLVESALFGILVHVDGRVAFSNQSMATMLGYRSPEQYLKNSQKEIPLPHVQDEKRRQVIDNLTRVQSGEVPVLFDEGELTKLDGSPLAFRSQSRRILWDGLPAVLSTLLDVTESKRLETEFEEQHTLLETILDNIPIMLYTKDKDRRLTYVNRALAHQYGGDPEQMIGKRSEELMFRPSEEITFMKELDTFVLTTGEGKVMPEYAVTLPNGDMSHREGALIPLQNSAKEVVGLVGMSMDITHRVKSDRELRESEIRFRAIVENLPYSIAIVFQETGHYAFVNEAFKSIFGIIEPIEDHHGVEFYVDPKDRDLLMEELKRNGRYGPMEVAYRSVDGTSFWALASGIAITYDGQPCFLNSFADVTDKRKAEAKLRKNEALLQAVFDALPMWLSVRDNDGLYLMVNRTMAEDLDFPMDRLGSFGYQDIYWTEPGRIEELIEEDREIIRTGQRIDPIERFMQLGKNRRITSNIVKVPVRDPDGAITGIVTANLNITELRDAQEETKRQHALLRTVFDALPLRIALKDSKGRYIMLNQAASKFLNFPMDRLGSFGNEDMHLLDEDARKEIIAEDQQIYSTGKRIEKFGQVMKLTDGREYILNRIKVPILDDKGNIDGIVVVSQDVTDLWESRKEAREKEALLQTVFDTLPLYMSVKDTRRRFIMMNRSEVEFLNFPTERLGTFSNDDIYWLNDAELRNVAEQDTRVLEKGERIDSIGNILRLNDGREFILNTIKVPIRDESGTITGLVTVDHDVTELWQARQETREKEALLQTVFDALPLRIAVKNIAGQFIMVNPAAAEFMNFPIDQLGKVGNEIMNLLDKETLEMITSEDDHILKSGERIEHFGQSMKLLDGRKLVNNKIKVPIRDENGNITGLVTVNQDVTELSQARQEAQDKQALLEAVFDALPLWIIVKDSEQRFLLANRALVEDVNFPVDRLGEFHNRDIYWVSETGKNSIITSDEHVLRTGQREESPDLILHREDGQIMHQHVVRAPIVAESGEITGLVAVVLDVTARKEAEIQLRKSEGLLHSVVDNIPVVLWALDQEGKITLSEGKGLLAQGLKPGELVGQSVFDIYREHPDFLEKVRQVLAGHSLVAIQETKGAVYERMMEPLREEDNTEAGLIGVSLDITQRHRAEMALRGSEERYRALVEGSVQGVIVYDLKDFRALFANETIIGMTDSKSLKELLEKENLFETVLEPYAGPLKKKLRQMAEGSLNQFQTEVFVTRNSKSNIWVEVIASSIDWDGIQAVQFTVMDISDRRRAEEAMKDQQALLTKQNEYFQQDISRRRERRHEGIIAESQAMQHVLREADLVAQSNIPILIEGETGTGKEVVAEYIHRQSTRSKQMLSVVNCGALTENLMDAELFGHEKGAFTGAGDARAGMIEIADRGTLFLDEIGDIPASAQVRLLRFLEQSVIRRVGSNREKKVNVRILAATHKTLKDQVANGNFREDLYHRLLVIRIVVPPLRDRLEDINPFAQQFLEQACLDAHVNIKTFGEDTRLALTRYGWPGNVRELSHTVQRAVFSAQLEGSNIIRPEHLDLHLPASSDEISLPVKEVKKRAEREHAISVLRHFKGNREKASDSLGISRRQLYRILN